MDSSPGLAAAPQVGEADPMAKSSTVGNRAKLRALQRARMTPCSREPQTRLPCAVQVRGLWTSEEDGLLAQWQVGKQ